MLLHNPVTGYIKETYSLQELGTLFSILWKNGTFTFPALENGLFPAAVVPAEYRYTGYRYVWVRDNIYVAYAHYLYGDIAVAVKNIKTLAAYFIKHQSRFENVISGNSDYHRLVNRPHIRFQGEDLTEIGEKWAHAQNDALGYFVWLFCKLHREGHAVISSEEKKLLALFALYFETIRYWEDEDSGHWEERRKVEASSIGVVTGGLEQFRMLMEKRTNDPFRYRDTSVTGEYLDCLISRGRKSLADILPAECVQDDPGRNRRYDAALLFLIFPMRAVDQAMADRILFDVRYNLQGAYGIRRYKGDSFWSADYKKHVKPEKRTADVSDDSSWRDRLLKPGEEAQWCIFDPIVSIIYGLKYQDSREKEDLQLQTHYFNRSLGQLTGQGSPFGALKCPELYYLEDGRYTPNDSVPLLWTQANLMMAFKFLKDNSGL